MEIMHALVDGFNDPLIALFKKIPSGFPPLIEKLSKLVLIPSLREGFPLELEVQLDRFLDLLPPGKNLTMGEFSKSKKIIRKIALTVVQNIGRVLDRAIEMPGTLRFNSVKQPYKGAEQKKWSNFLPLQQVMRVANRGLFKQWQQARDQPAFKYSQIRWHLTAPMPLMRVDFLHHILMTNTAADELIQRIQGRNLLPNVHSLATASYTHDLRAPLQLNLNPITLETFNNNSVNTMHRCL
jgi:hypothetical protein